MMSGDPPDKAKSHWDAAYDGEHADQARICNIYTLASVLYWRLYGNRCFGNTGDEYGWLSWLKRVYGASPRARVLELGSGNGDLLLDLRRIKLADEFVGLDISEIGVQVASGKAAEAGYANVKFSQCDLNRLTLEAGAYDMVVTQMSLHHLENLEQVFEQVAQALMPGGSFAANDYVGPTRWQFTPMQLILANAILQVLPRRLRVRYPDGKIKSIVGRPTVQQMIEMDPSEAVRSEEIVPLFQRYFTLEHRIDYGGSVSILVLDNIIDNFRATDPSSVKWLRVILAIDHWARRTGLVPPINLVLAGRPKHDGRAGRSKAGD
jgi:ubiquinone/menaquinone biosynthesis C-methylase UbiE